MQSHLTLAALLRWSFLIFIFGVDITLAESAWKRDEYRLPRYDEDVFPACQRPKRDQTTILQQQPSRKVFAFISNPNAPKRLVRNAYPDEFTSRYRPPESEGLLTMQMFILFLFRAFIEKSSGIVWLVDEWPHGPIDLCGLWNLYLFRYAKQNSEVTKIMLVDRDDPFRRQRVYWQRGDPDDGTHREYEPTKDGFAAIQDTARILLPPAVAGVGTILPSIINGVTGSGSQAHPIPAPHGQARPNDHEADDPSDPYWMQDTIPSTHAQAPQDTQPGIPSSQEIEAYAPTTDELPADRPTTVNQVDAQSDIQTTAQGTEQLWSDAGTTEEFQPGKRSLNPVILKRACPPQNYDWFFQDQEPADSGEPYKLGATQFQPDPGVAKEQTANLYNSQIRVTLHRGGKLTLPSKAELMIQLGDTLQPIVNKIWDFLVPNQEKSVTKDLSVTFEQQGKDFILRFRSGDEVWDSKSTEHGCQSSAWQNGKKVVQCGFRSTITF